MNFQYICWDIFDKKCGEKEKRNNTAKKKQKKACSQSHDKNSHCQQVIISPSHSKGLILYMNVFCVSFKSLDDKCKCRVVFKIQSKVINSVIAKQCAVLLTSLNRLQRQFWRYNKLNFSSPGRSPGRAIVLPPASASAAALALAKC